MAVQLNVNSFVSVEDADLYFADRLDVAAWTEADVVEKGKALVTATMMLDRMDWAGTAVSFSQKLAFPRVVTYLDPKLGLRVQLDGSAVPNRIILATLEQAYHLLNNDGLLDDSDSVKSLEIGPLSLSGVKRPPRVPETVSSLIKPLLTSVSRLVTRGN